MHNRQILYQLGYISSPYLLPGRQGFTLSRGWSGNHYIDHADRTLAAILLPLPVLKTQACTTPPSEPAGTAVLEEKAPSECGGSQARVCIWEAEAEAGGSLSYS